MPKTNNPDKICKSCGNEIPTDSPWVQCPCGALNHVKMKSSDGRVRKTICHVGEQANNLRKRLLDQGVPIVQIASNKY